MRIPTYVRLSGKNVNIILATIQWELLTFWRAKDFRTVLVESKSYHLLSIVIKQLTMSLPTVNTWKQAILANRFSDAGNKNLQSFMAATADSTTSDDRLRALTEDPLTTMLAVAPVTSKIKLYFGLSNLGGTRYVKDDKIVGFEGLSSSANPLVFSKTDVEALVTVTGPTKTDLKTVKTEKNLEDVPVGQRVNLKNSRFVLLPPFLNRSSSASRYSRPRQAILGRHGCDQCL